MHYTLDVDVDHRFVRLTQLELMSAAGSRRYAVFRTIEEACAWLGNAGGAATEHQTYSAGLDE